MTSGHVEAIDINPLHWLGSTASAAVGDVWKSAMIGLWSAALWLLKLAFTVIDAFTTPDLSANGPMGSVLPSTLWIGATLAAVMMFVQLTVALVRRDGQSVGRVLLGIGQFGLVWVGYLGVAAGLVAAASGLERGILSSMLDVQDLHSIDLSKSWPTSVSDITLATVLGVLSLLLVIPSAFFYVLIMFVREAALIILVATAPISAAGLVADAAKVWFWKTLRWFFACLLIAPTAALLLGIGVKISDGVVNPPSATRCKAKCTADDMARFANDMTAAHAGMAVVGCVVIAIGACCPLVLFRLLAFVEPGTASGAALRQSWSDAGGLSGVVGNGRESIGSGAALLTGSDGRSGGEAGAEAHTQSRMAGLLGSAGVGVQAVTSLAQRAVDIGSDILGQAGVGAPGYSMTPMDEQAYRRARRSSVAGRSDGAEPGAEPTDGPPTSPGPTPGPVSLPPVGPVPQAAGAGEAGAATAAAL